jgi:hypothetical protein
LVFPSTEEEEGALLIVDDGIEEACCCNGSSVVSLKGHKEVVNVSRNLHIPHAPPVATLIQFSYSRID